MCLPIILFVLKVLVLQGVTAYPYKDYIIAYIPIEDFAFLTSSTIETIPLPPSMSYYGNVVMYADPQDLGGVRLEDIYSPYVSTSGPVSFGGPVNAAGSVSVVGGYGNQGPGTYVCYSSPASSVVVTTLPESYATSPIATTPFITGTTLPGAALASTEIVPAVVSIPSSIVPVSTATATASSSAVETTSNEFAGVTVTSEVDVETTSTSSVSNSVWDANVPIASPAKFSGYVPASGNVRIYANFC